MDPARPDRELVVRALAEAIESVTTRAVRESVLAAALREARRSRVPERGPEVLEFARGPLRHVLSLRVGPETATEVLQQIAPVLERASMLAARAGAPEAPLVERRVRTPAPDGEEGSGVFVSHRAVTDPAPTAAIPVVFLASRDADAAIAMASRLGGLATVRMVEGLLDLLDAIDEEDEGAERIVVIDGARPAVQVPSVVTVSAELVGRAQVLLWRCGPGDRAALRMHTPEGSWASRGHTLDDLAEACLRALSG